MDNPEISVVVVSDYEPNHHEKTWQDERRILQALAAQDIDEPFEVILVENSAAAGSVPEDLPRICPRLAIVFHGAQQSAHLKDCGVRHAKGELVAVLEADCLPGKEWLRVLTDTLRTQRQFSVVSGRTTYGDETMYRRCLSVLDRSYDDLGQPGRTLHVSNNGAVYRKSVLEAFPYPPAATPFLSSRLRANAMHLAGQQFYFDPRAVMRHAIGGAAFIMDFRRNTGFADMQELKRPRWTRIPGLLWIRRTKEWKDCARTGPVYLRWYDWPLLIGLLVVVPFLEIPGMLDALRQKGAVPRSAYR